MALRFRRRSDAARRAARSLLRKPELPPPASAMHVTSLGAGPTVVLVHGGVVDGKTTWRAQLALAERWTLVVPDRPGFAQSSDVEHVGFEADARLVAELLGEGAHLAGH